MQVRNNIPNKGRCLCGCAYDANGICSDPNCPTKEAYDAGYRAKTLIEQFPIEEDDLD